MNDNIWWAKSEVGENSWYNCSIGPLRLAVKRLAWEWRIYYDRQEFSRDEYQPFFSDQDHALPSESLLKERYVFSHTEPYLHLIPALADRSVVSRPYNPFTVPARQEITIFVSTPLWLRIEVHDPLVRLVDMPILIPSDTWFGPSTMEGMLCYASNTSARIRLQELPKRPHRAITPILVCNESSEAFLLERLSLPVPYLDLYETDDGFLWTQGVKMVRKEDGESGLIKILEGPPSQVDQATLLTESREEFKGRTIVRAISDLLA